MKISRHCLNVKDLGELVEFYERIPGMCNFGTCDNPLLGYDAEECLLELTGGIRWPGG